MADLVANQMRRDPVRFPFRAKLFIAGNHKPTFPSTNTAVAERLMLISFRMHFLNSDEDSDFRNDPNHRNP